MLVLGSTFFWGVGILVVGGLLVAAYVEWKKRIAAMEALANRLGLAFDRKADKKLDDRFRQFAIFRKGRGRQASNTLRGSMTLAGDSREVILGDYEYTIQNGDNSKTIHLSFMLLETPGLLTPELIIRPEGMFDRLKAAIGFDDIDFESAEFSRRFHVSSTDKRFAWDLIDPRMMEFLMQGEDVTLDLEAGWLCVVTGKRWKVDRFEPLLGYAEGFLSRWPDQAVRQLKAGQYRQGDTA